MSELLVGSVEAGGTKFVCAVGDEHYQVKDKVTFATTTPQETLARVVTFFKKFPNVTVITVASFGPIELRKNHAKYGYITNTPKIGWHDVDFVGYLKKELARPIIFTTDVNGSAYGEYVAARIAQQPVDSLVYYTVGTGVGAGAIIDGQLIGTLGHPEMGHVLVKRHPDDLKFEGICPFHGDCLEGLIAGPTFEKRVGKKGQDVDQSDPVLDIMAYYLAQAVVQQTLIIRPNKIILGGGVVNKIFLDKVRLQFKEQLNNYVEVPKLEDYITMPLVENNGSATLGDFALALKQYNQK